MAKHHVSRQLPSLFHPEIAARNGRIPTAGGFRRFAEAYNAVATRQRKLLICKSQDLRHMISPPSSPAVVWSFYFRTGENVTSIDAYVGLTATESIFPGIPAQVIVDVYRASDDVRMNIGNEGSLVYDSTVTGDILGADVVSHNMTRITGLAQDTEYYCETRCLFGARLAYLTAVETPVREADDQVLVICNPGRYGRGAPIKRLAIEELATAARELWRHNASQLFAWCSNYQEDTASDPSTSSTSFTDLIADSSAMRIETTMRGTLQRPNAIPVKMAVKARRTAGSGTADFRIFDGTNSIQISAAAITSTKDWFTTTGTLSGTPATWRMQHRVSVGTTTVRTMAWSLFQWEA